MIRLVMPMALDTSPMDISLFSFCDIGDKYLIWKNAKLRLHRTSMYAYNIVVSVEKQVK